MSGIDRLLDIMAKLRDPDEGCPWDIEQDFASIAPHTIEEAYEVDDAIRQGDFAALRDELGDLLLQVVFHAQMAQEEARFSFDDVVEAIADKLVRRHPHVFEGERIGSAAAQTDAWEAQKASERAKRGQTSIADGIALGLPALLRASKLLLRAKRAGFAWPGAEHAIAKIREEIEEVEAEIVGGDAQRLRDEVGDVLIAAAGLATTLGCDPEEALRASLVKFETRLRAVEAELGCQERTFAEASPAELLALWDAAKRSES